MLRTTEITFLPAMRDIIFSKASQLHPHLIFDPNAKDAGAIISFIINSSDEFLKDLSNAVDKQDSNQVQLVFFEKTSEKKLAQEIPYGKLSEYINKGYKVSVKGNMAPLVAHSDEPCIYFVAITFYTYN